MQIRFVKNIQFTRLVKANGRLREFNFRKLRGSEEELFSVDVCDDRGNRILFRMQKIDNTWNIADQELPAWVLQNEKNFHELIEEELRKV